DPQWQEGQVPAVLRTVLFRWYGGSQAAGAEYVRQGDGEGAAQEDGRQGAAANGQAVAGKGTGRGRAPVAIRARGRLRGGLEGAGTGATARQRHVPPH